MKKALAISSLALLMATPAMSAPWVRGYILNNYELASYYGGRGVSTQAPGTDCPKGTNADNNYRQLLKTAWRSDAEIDKIIATSLGGGSIMQAAYFRGFRKDINTYINPFAAPDPGMQQVSGKIAEGFNLDGKAATGGFTNPQGEDGVDNQLFRTMGCVMSYRGTPYHAYLNVRGIDKMIEGMYNIVVRVSGNEDPMNDKHAVVEIGYTPDHIVKDPASNVTPDYSFRIVKTAQYTKLNAVIKDGVVDTEQVPNLNMPAFAWFESNRGNVDFQKGKLRFSVAKDGSISGLVGGYRDWRDVYAQTSFNTATPLGTNIEAATMETYYHENRIGIYYALIRNADGIPDANGKMTAISAAFRFTAVPAYVVDGAIAANINEPPPPGTTGVIDAQRAAFFKASTSHVIQADPSPKYRAMLNAHRAGYDDNAAPAPVSPPKGVQQVNNTASGTTTATQ